VGLRGASKGYDGIGGAKRGLQCYSVFAKNVSVFAVNVLLRRGL
jgi:hypothetical protein